MISAFANTWKVAELRERIIYTLLMIVVVRLGVYITMPGIDSTVIDTFIESQKNKSGGGNIINTMVTVFSGGGLTQLGIFALGIMPYISASILMQLLTAVYPKLAKLSREDGGRQKINQYTRFATIIIAVVQGGFLARQIYFNPDSLPMFSGISNSGGSLIAAGWGAWQFISIFVITIVAGTLFLMWIGDQMTENGIGNGTSIIITINIISALPGALGLLWTKLIIGGGTGGSLFAVFLFAFLIFIVAATIALTQATRNIVIQQAKRTQGRKQYGGGGQKTYLPLKLNYANVMPIIFATAILGIPPVLFSMMGGEWAISLGEFFRQDGIWYYLIAGAMIFFFSYFWVATMFNPSEISENLKRSGGYVPGIRPGQPTAKFLDYTMTRLTFAGAIFLTIIFVLPFLISQLPAATLNITLDYTITQFFGGTSLLIMVGVVLDIMRQVETHLIQQNYDGFLRKGKIKGRQERKQMAANNAKSNNVVYLLAVIAIIFILGIVALFYT